MNLSINQQWFEIKSDPDDMLLWVLRDELGLSGTKFGCGAGICGACTVHIDGVAMRSCQIPVITVEGKAITTIEGLSEGETLHLVQQAFLNAQVPQCAWCMSGQMMTAAAFLVKTPKPSSEEIENAMSNNYCRCGCYARIRVAVAQAAKGQVG
jgi:isoquinoline 1-oxidoreductase subunit alpha